ncbi:MAG: phage protein Gp36 family protein [bacterium]
MNSLVRYAKSSKARFDFRVPDGHGHWVYPDWDDPGLKVEFYDSEGTLQFTATAGSDPALVQGDDYHEDYHPGGGKFVEVSGLDLAGFALGTANAHVYAKVSGTEVSPCPSIIAAFEVVADAPAGPCYAEVSAVKQEMPGAWPASVTDEMVARAIASASRRIDAYLETSYQVPFADINADPPAPALVELICRKLAAYQCLEWMGRANAADQAALENKALQELEKLAPKDGKVPTVRLAGYQGPLPFYQGKLEDPNSNGEDYFDGVS